jgi:hypothetical protein
MLFNGPSVLQALPDQERRIREEIQSLKADYVLNVSEDDLLASLVGKYTLYIPILSESDISVDYGEHKVDVSRDRMRIFDDRSGPIYVAGTSVTFIVPFQGDPNLFGVQPQTFSYSLSGSNPEIVGTEIRITYAGANLNAATARRTFDGELGQIKQNLANLKTAIDRHNAGLAELIRAEIQKRKQKLLADANIASEIGFPIRRRHGVPTTYAVPVQKRKPKIETPVVSSGKFQPEPALAMAEYDEILGIVRSMVHVMERSPKAFEKMGEEDLRTQFLVQLNGQYEGRATGETFNFQGKTDILIREGDRNVFIAECKFWAGEKQYLETIDQVLSYLSWRDTKAAVLIFNRNVNFTDVLAQIVESTPKHPHYKRTVAKLDESSVRYVFRLPGDPNRELTLSVLAFNVPTLHEAERAQH